MLFWFCLQRLINTLDYSNVWRLTGWHTIVMNYTVKDIDVKCIMRWHKTLYNLLKKFLVSSLADIVTWFYRDLMNFRLWNDLSAFLFFFKRKGAKKPLVGNSAENYDWRDFKKIKIHIWIMNTLYIIIWFKAVDGY